MFRKEVLAAKNERLLGKTHLTQPVSYTVLGLFCGILLAIIVAFLLFGHYTQREVVAGQLVVRNTQLEISAPQSAKLIKLFVKAGQSVKQGEVLFELLTSQEGKVPFCLGLLHETASREPASSSTLAAVRCGCIKVSLMSPITASGFAPHWGDLWLQSRHLMMQSPSSLLLEQLIECPLLKCFHAPIAHPITRRFDLEQQATRRLSRLEAYYSLFPSCFATPVEHRVLVQAPQSGTILNIFSDLNTNLAAEVTVLTLQTEQLELQAELRVPIQAMGLIEAEDRVILRYAAYPYQRFGLQYAQIAQFMPLTSNNLVSDSSQHSVQDYYLVLARLEQQFVVAQGVKRPLFAGMPLSAVILLERRTLLAWLLQPLYSSQAR